MTTGQHAEQVAANHLQQHGYHIVDRNWSTSWCEIDIVAKKNGCVYFCEVKYRKTHTQGGGLDYITPAKLQRMTNAAESWMQRHTWDGPCQLCAIEVTGDEYQVTAVITDDL